MQLRLRQELAERQNAATRPFQARVDQYIAVDAYDYLISPAGVIVI